MDEAKGGHADEKHPGSSVMHKMREAEREPRAARSRSVVQARRARIVLAFHGVASNIDYKDFITGLDYVLSRI